MAETLFNSKFHEVRKNVADMSPMEKLELANQQKQITDFLSTHGRTVLSSEMIEVLPEPMKSQVKSQLTEVTLYVTPYTHSDDLARSINLDNPSDEDIWLLARLNKYKMKLYKEI